MKHKEKIFKTCDTESFTRALLQSGHDQAASSFSEVLGHEVGNSEVLVQVSSNPVEAPCIIKGDGQLTVIISEVMGELKGKSYLILNEDELDLIQRLCLGEKSKGQIRSLGPALLRELVNMLTSAVIKEFSNKLNVNAYGDVPRIFSMRTEDIQTMVQEDLNDDFVSDLFITTDTRFTLGGNEVYQPQLILKLGEPFLFLVYQHTQKAYQNY